MWLSAADRKPLIGSTRVIMYQFFAIELHTQQSQRQKSEETARGFPTERHFLSLIDIPMKLEIVFLLFEIPDSIVEGIKTIIENMEVFAWSFTASPMILAILSDTAIKIARLIKYFPGFCGISASKTSGAAIYKIMLIRNR